jgi:hypothetical protein
MAGVSCGMGVKALAKGFVGITPGGCSRGFSRCAGAGAAIRPSTTRLPSATAVSCFDKDMATLPIHCVSMELPASRILCTAVKSCKEKTIRSAGAIAPGRTPAASWLIPANPSPSRAGRLAAVLCREIGRTRTSHPLWLRRSRHDIRENPPTPRFHLDTKGQRRGRRFLEQGTIPGRYLDPHPRPHAAQPSRPANSRWNTTL